MIHPPGWPPLFLQRNPNPPKPHSFGPESSFAFPSFAFPSFAFPTKASYSYSLLSLSRIDEEGDPLSRRRPISRLSFPLTQILVDLLSEDPPPYNPQEEPRDHEADPVAPSSQDSPPVASPVASRLRGKREPSPPDSTSRAFPLRQGNNGQL